LETRSFKKKLKDPLFIACVNRSKDDPKAMSKEMVMREGTKLGMNEYCEIKVANEFDEVLDSAYSLIIQSKKTILTPTPHSTTPPQSGSNATIKKGKTGTVTVATLRSDSKKSGMNDTNSEFLTLLELKCRNELTDPIREKSFKSINV